MIICCEGSGDYVKRVDHEAAVQAKDEALLRLAHAVFGNGTDSEPDVYADYDKLCELEAATKAALEL